MGPPILTDGTNKVGMLLAPLLKSAVGELATGVWEEALARSKVKG